MTTRRVPIALALGLTLLGLAACSGGGGSEAPAEPPANPPVDAPAAAPAITRFAANRPVFFTGDSLTLLAVFENGTGTVDQGVGAVTSGQPVVLSPFTGERTFTLTVTNARGDRVSATTAVSMGLGNGRHVQAASVLVDGKVLITGGFDGAARADAQLFDPSTGTSVTTATPMTVGRYGHTSTLLPNGKVLLAGGSDAAGALATAELYDPVAGTFTATTGPMTVARYAHTATFVGGKVLLAGGVGAAGTLASAELYDPATDSFTATTGAMSVARQGHTATVLSSGLVLVAGGSDGAGATLGNAELYDPTSGTFTGTVGGLATARRDHTATPLPGTGSVLIVGGRDAGGAALASAELYDPGAGTFVTTTGSLGAARFGHTATPLHDGTVLLVGGTGDGRSGLASTEIYSPSAGTFAAAPSQLGTARLGHTAVLLQTGRILATGGDDGTSFSAAAETLDEANPPVFLIVGEANDNTAALQGSLTAGGYGNESRNPMGLNAMPLPELVGYAGVAFTMRIPPDGALLPSVKAYLDAGGKLLVFYNDIGYSWRETAAPNFFTTYFGVSYGADYGSDGPVTGTDIMAGVACDVSSDQYPDSLIISAGSDAVGIFQNQAPLTDWAGIRIARNGYKAVVMGFRLDSVTDTTTRDGIVQKSVGWLTTP